MHPCFSVRAAKVTHDAEIDVRNGLTWFVAELREVSQGFPQVGLRARQRSEFLFEHAKIHENASEKLRSGVPAQDGERLQIEISRGAKLAAMMTHNSQIH